MQKLTQILLFCLTAYLLTGQVAPDFTITDSDGVVHNLYEDHLDQGQIVVIKLFFIDCPICKPYIDPFQALYEELGEGEEDVEFIMLSNKTWDSNEEVAQYKIDYSITCVASGYDGGGYDAAQPYSDGTFGVNYGTPAFMVIAPDGTLYHGVAGPGVDGTMDAIRQKIYNIRDGTAVDTTVMVNVDIQMYNDNLTLPEYQLVLRSADNHENKYLVPKNFTYPSVNYPAVPNPEITVNINKIDHDKITTLDLVIIQRNLLGLEVFDGFQIKASDVNGTGSGTAADLLQMRKLILRLIDNFPVGKSYFGLNSECRTNEDACNEAFSLVTDESELNFSFTIMKYGNVK